MTSPIEGDVFKNNNFDVLHDQAIKISHLPQEQMFDV